MVAGDEKSQNNARELMGITFDKLPRLTNSKTTKIQI